MTPSATPIAQGRTRGALPGLRVSAGAGLVYLGTKRLIDVVASVIGLIVLLPIFAGVAAAIKWDSPGPVLYGSTRIGRGGVPFRMWKFRTMVPGADRLGSSVTTDGDPRVTPVGRILRRSKLDELPSLWNVLVGEMTLVGPRPETPAWVKHYTPEMSRVLETRPGITDFAQILFRHEEHMLKGAVLDEGQYLAVMRWKVALQAEYLRRRSLLTDQKVLFHTFRAILDREPDVELERLVASASARDEDGLPMLLRRRAERVWGTEAGAGVVRA